MHILILPGYSLPVDRMVGHTDRKAVRKADRKAVRKVGRKAARKVGRKAVRKVDRKAVRKVAHIGILADNPWLGT